jgi:hypothetical protein
LWKARNRRIFDEKESSVPRIAALLHQSISCFYQANALTLQ